MAQPLVGVEPGSVMIGDRSAGPVRLDDAGLHAADGTSIPWNEITGVRIIAPEGGALARTWSWVRGLFTATVLSHVEDGAEVNIEVATTTGEHRTLTAASPTTAGYPEAERRAAERLIASLIERPDLRGELRTDTRRVVDQLIDPSP